MLECVNIHKKIILIVGADVFEIFSVRNFLNVVTWTTRWHAWRGDETFSTKKFFGCRSLCSRWVSSTSNELCVRAKVRKSRRRLNSKKSMKLVGTLYLMALHFLFATLCRSTSHHSSILWKLLLWKSRK